LCSEEFYQTLQPLLEKTGGAFPTCKENQRCSNGKESDILEECFWEALTVIRKAMEDQRPIVDALAQKLVDAQGRLNSRARRSRSEAPSVNSIYEIANNKANTIPAELTLTPGETTTLRGALGSVLRYYNKASNGSIFSASADLLGSTSVNVIGLDFPQGYFNADTNPGSRVLSVGGICEDAMAGIMAGLSTYGQHIGVCSSYGAFIASLGHIASRLHAIGNQARQAIVVEPYKPFILICAHAGIKTGEDGPTHADPQPLQLLQENFPKGTVITLTPWDPQEIWTLVSTSLAKRPAVICPFVTRPNESIVDRQALGLAPSTDAASGVYLLHRSKDNRRGCLVLQGSEVAYTFVDDVLPRLKERSIDIDVYYVASAELFDLLPQAEQDRIFPEERAREAMGITGFTLPTLYRWIQSKYGRAMSIHAFSKGHFLGSGKAEVVMKEAGLDGEGQFEAILRYLDHLKIGGKK
jgi:transketolase